MNKKTLKRIEIWVDELRAIESKDCGYCKHGSIYLNEREGVYYCSGGCGRALIYDRWGFDSNGNHVVTGNNIAPGCVTRKDLIESFGN